MMKSRNYPMFTFVVWAFLVFSVLLCGYLWGRAVGLKQGQRGADRWYAYRWRPKSLADFQAELKGQPGVVCARGDEIWVERGDTCHVYLEDRK